MKRKLTLKNIIILVLALIFIGGYIRQERAIKRIEGQKNQLEAQLEELKEKNVRLQEEASNALSDEYLEQLARERLKMIKEGEKVVDGGSSQTAENTESNSEN